MVEVGTIGGMLEDFMGDPDGLPRAVSERWRVRVTLATEGGTVIVVGTLAARLGEWVHLDQAHAIDGGSGATMPLGRVAYPAHAVRRVQVME